jgi:hypothetical protein
MIPVDLLHYCSLATGIKKTGRPRNAVNHDGRAGTVEGPAGK